MVRYQRSAQPGLWELKTCRQEWHSRRPHSHGEWSLGFVESGTCLVGCGGQSILVRAPALVWFAPETVHECRPLQSAEWGFQMVYWNGTPADPDATGWGHQPLAPAEVSVWAGFFRALGRGETPAAVPELMAARGFGIASSAVAANPEKTPFPDESFRPVSRPDRPYKRVYGLAPARHRTVLRLRRAQQLLRRGLPPAEVALETGFYDQSQFTRLFRSLTGTTPARYARG